MRLHSEYDSSSVSIHTRHYWRVKQAQHSTPHRVGRFNPHPPLLAGETALRALSFSQRRSFNPHPPLLAGETAYARHHPSPRLRFNPHPPLLAGETRWQHGLTRSKNVSIHTRHYWRVKLVLPAQIAHMQGVSIHTRHYWRVKPGPSAAWDLGPNGFNPHPPLLAGETCF